MLPVANVKAQSVGAKGDPDRAEVRGRVLEKLVVGDEAKAGAVTLETRAKDLLFAKIAEEKVALIFDRQRVVVVTERAGGGAAAEIVHHPERVGLPGNEIIRITVEPAVHHVRQAAHPVMFVGVVVSEHLVLFAQSHIEDVPHTGAVNLQVRAVGPQAKNTAAHLHA